MARRRRGDKRLNSLHEWVSFEDPGEDRTWVFDVTFLLSSWTCIYGRGCQGVLTAAAPELEHGCCSYGAHLTDDEDATRIERVAATLTPEQAQQFSAGEWYINVHTQDHQAGEIRGQIRQREDDEDDELPGSR